MKIKVPRIAQNSIESIKHQVNLVDIVSPYVQLKRAGRSWKGLSPFTTEKTPSFYVHPDRGFFKCFSTGEGGDCFSFVMKMENLEFYEAIEYIAEKFNIKLEYEEGGPSREEMSLRKQIFELHELASDWFHRQLIDSKEAAPVRKYWKEARGFGAGIAKEYKIGYAPAAPNAFALFCKEKKIATAAMHQSGLFFARDREQEHGNFKSRFRGRLMIPIRDVQGRVVAFTARQLEQTPQDDPAREAKYVNSPETPIFHKGRILFGLDHARTHLKEGGSFLLVEGQIDAIRCWTVGLHTAIAPQGTAITEEQLALLSRYEPAAVECLLDGDAAGRKAAVRALPLAFKAGLEFRFLLLPEKADPDDLLRADGAAALESLRAKAKSGIELSIEESLPGDRAPGTQDKSIALRKVFELLAHVPSEVAREDYIQTAARILKVDAQAALRDYTASMRTRHRAAGPRTNESAPAPRKDPLLTQATWDILWLVLHHPEHTKTVSELIDYEWINADSPAARLLSRLLAEFREGLIDDSSEIDKLLDSSEERQLLADIHSRDLELEEPKEQIENYINKLRRKHHERRIKELEQESLNAEPEQRIELMRERKRLVSELSKPLKL